MEKFFTYYSREIPVDKVFLLTEEILGNLYASFSEIEGCNVFFHLQNEYFYLQRFTPGAIRTLDLLLRRQLLYPAELQAHTYNNNLSKTSFMCKH